MTRPGFLVITPVACAIGLAAATTCGCGFNATLAVATVLLLQRWRTRPPTC